jgi:hypothetical protein
MNIYDSGPETLQASCTTLMSDIEFILIHNPDGVYLPIDPGTAPAVFYPLGQGTGDVRMGAPAGIGLPNVYCQTTGRQGQTLSAYDWVYVSIYASFDVSIPDAASIYCDVFVVNGGIPVEQPVRDPAIVEGMPPATPSDSPPVSDPSEDAGDAESPGESSPVVIRSDAFRGQPVTGSPARSTLRQ